MTSLPPGIEIRNGRAYAFHTPSGDKPKLEEWACARALQWYEDNRKWPSERGLAIVAGVGKGTAGRGLKAAKEVKNLNNPVTQ